MARIIAGTFGGRRIQAPSGTTTRPTSDRIREALFSSLSASHDLDAGPFLDLYAGSGAIGLEAISRGAPRAVFIDTDPNAVKVIKANIAALGVLSQSTVITSSAATSAGLLSNLQAETVFADPPYMYETQALVDTLTAMHAAAAIAQDALVVVERGRRDDWTWPPQFAALRDRRYGDTRLWYGRAL